MSGPSDLSQTCFDKALDSPLFIVGSDRDWCLFRATFAGQQSGFLKEENGFVGTRPMKPLHAPVSKAALTCSVLCSLDFGRSGIATVTLLTSLHVANPWRPIPKFRPGTQCLLLADIVAKVESCISPNFW
jgi:hypothetical protein